MRALVPVLCLATASCSVVNDVDVCERELPPGYEINARTEGDQGVGSGRPVMPLPSGRAVVFFLSQPSGAANEQRMELRGRVVAADGLPQPTCAESQEFTYSEATSDSTAVDRMYSPSVTTPAGSDVPGFVAYARDAATASVYLHAVGESACPINMFEPLLVAEVPAPPCVVARGVFDPTEPPPESNCIRQPRPVRLASADDVHTVAVVWDHSHIHAGGASSRLYARVARITPWAGIAEFLPVAGSLDGDPVVLPGGEAVDGHDAIGLGDGTFAVAWNEPLHSDSSRVSLRRFDDRLNPIGEQIDVSGRYTPPPPGESYVTTASDGESILVAWAEGDAEGGSQIVGRVLDADGNPRTERFTIHGHGVVQRTPAAIGLSQGGFAIAWETLDATRDERTSSITSVILGPYGQRTFVNPACDRAPFQVSSVEIGAQRFPSIAQLASGSLLWGWTDDGWNGPDMSGSSVRVRIARERDLFPVK